MALVMTHVLEPLCAERIALLEAAGKKVSVAEAVAVFVNALEPAAARIGMDAPMFFRLAGRIQCLPADALPDGLRDARSDVTKRFLAAVSKDFAADWAFFEAGLAQSLVIEADSKHFTALTERWIAFGVRGLGETAVKPNDDAQGLLFDF